jgi:manganese/zinc/iron transport system permease protein
MRSLAGVLIALSLMAATAWHYGPAPMQDCLGWAAQSLGAEYNTMVVLLGTGALGLAAGVVGSFAVLRRRSLVGDAVAHAALPGLAIAFMLIGERRFSAMLLGALATGLMGSLAISWLQKNTRLKADAAIGIVLSVLFGLGIVLSRIVQDDPSGRQAGLDSFLLGKTAGMVSQDLILIALTALLVLATVGLFYKELELVCFDSPFASVQGLPVLALDTLLMGLLAAITVIGLPAVGVVLMAALLIIPAVSARFWTDRLGTMVVLAGGFGLATGAGGSWVSASFSDLPAGAVIVLTGSVLFAISMSLAPRRGIVARLLRMLRTSYKITSQNFLRTMYEVSQDGDQKEAVAIDDILLRRAWSRRVAELLILIARRRGDVAPAGERRWRLTAPGLERAIKIVRAHRLWEIFLTEHAALAPDHVDRDADEIEHVVSAELLRELTETLERRGRLPGAHVPASVHGFGEEG